MDKNLGWLVLQLDLKYSTIMLVSIEILVTKISMNFSYAIIVNCFKYLKHALRQ